jgi:hypothetical protein
MKEPGGDPIRKIYRSYVHSAVTDPFVQRSKKELVDAAFKPSYSGPAALGLLLVLLGFAFGMLFLFHPELFRLKRAQERPGLEMAGVKRELGAISERVAAGGGPEAPPLRPPVEVIRLSNRGGPAMVYQTLQGDAPLTVIWVLEATL